MFASNQCLIFFPPPFVLFAHHKLSHLYCVLDVCSCLLTTIMFLLLQSFNPSMAWCLRYLTLWSMESVSYVAYQHQSIVDGLIKDVGMQNANFTNVQKKKSFYMPNHE